MKPGQRPVVWADLVGKVAVASNVLFVGASIQVLHATRGFAREVSDAGSQEAFSPSPGMWQTCTSRRCVSSLENHDMGGRVGCLLVEGCVVCRLLQRHIRFLELEVGGCLRTPFWLQGFEALSLFFQGAMHAA